MLNIWKTEPVLVLGVIASIIVLVAQQLLASGIVTSAGNVNLLNFVIAIVPALVAIIQRTQVTPVADPPTS